jgi:uncharacterized cysteine cluster protein YcgN (CxxCxxCC family)
MEKQFWKDKTLSELSPKEWEALCDRCGKCCLHRLEDEDTKEIHFTNVVCSLLDVENCYCKDYMNRSTLVPNCITMTIKDLDAPYWLPSTCAYRLLAEGKQLPQWHPLVSNSQETVFSSGNSIYGRVINENDADDLEYHLIDWIK